jgi:hypothetical protein
MSEQIEIAGVVAAAILIGVVLELVRRRKLTEEYSLVWLVSAGVLLAASLRREALQTVGHWLGIAQPPVVLLAIATLILLVVSLCLSVVVSRQRRQIDRLMEDTAILSAELRELRSGTEPAERVIANAPRNRLEARR